MYLEYWLYPNTTGNRIINLSTVRWGSLELLVKRIIDAAAAAALLVVLSPIFLLAAALIKLTSPGPVYFRQERLGLNRQPFMMWKFRTMTPQAEQQEVALRRSVGGVFFKIQDDPRITPVGRWLRRYSIDELPQLVNVLTGEMSLVGPRPIRDFERRQFDEWKQLRRFSMKPGLTCLWQVNGRSRTSDDDRLRYDLDYVDRWSFLLDAKILLKTIPVVLKGDGAM